MKRSFLEALENRRSYYRLWDKSPVSDKEIVEMLNKVITHVPSAFNSQSTRMVLLLGEHHRRLWDIVKTELKKIVSPEAIKSTERKIDNGFRSGYGTVLFYEDRTVVARMQRENPLYSDRFPPGRNRRQACTRLPYGQCWRTWDSGLHCSTITRLSTVPCAKSGTSAEHGS